MKKILVLDDDQDILQIVEDVLTYEEFAVKGISTSAEFLEIALNFSPDLVLLDYLLPDVDGGKLCQQIKAHPTLKHIPVILFSAYYLSEADYKQFGCDAVITKPFDINDMVECINNLLTAHAL